MKKKKNKAQQLIEAVNRAQKFRESEWYGIRGMLSYQWAIFYCLLGAREAGKSYSVMEFFVS